MSNDKHYPSFGEAFLFGQSAQDRVADLLRLQGALCDKKEAKARHDFQAVWHTVHRVEVKNEDRWAKKRTICVETRQGVPLRVSGVAYSDADLFVHTLGDMCALYRRREMVEFLRNEAANGKRFERSFGDNNNKGFILSINEMIDYPWFDHLPMNQLPQSKLWEM